MKKLFLLIIVFIFTVSCSSSDDSNTNSHLNPPKWIQGTWVQRLNEEPNTITGGWKFTKNDFCVISITGNQTFCLGQTFLVPPDESITAIEYKFTIHTGQISNNYHFIKVSDTKIKYEANDGIERIYTKE